MPTFHYSQINSLPMNNFIDIQRDYFFIKYFKKLDKRFWSFKIALNLFLQRNGQIILETGCIREKDDWGAGNSTMIFGEFCKKFDKQLITVDNDPEHLEFCEEETKDFRDHISYELSHSVDYIENLDMPIDLLFLDSLDCKEGPYDENIEAQSYALEELKAALPNLHDKSIILIDDNLFANGGKTKLCKEYLQKHGWINLIDYKQTLWIKK